MELYMEENIGWTAAFLAVLYFSAPVATFLNVIRGKILFEDSPGIFVTTCYINCFSWYIYGDLIFSEQIKYSYLVGACISLLLIIIYLIYEFKKYFIDTILNILILITGTWAEYRGLKIVIDDDRVVGKFCIATSIIMYLTPLYILYRVIKEKNYKLIPIFPAFVYLLACIAWVVYGALSKEFYIIFSHTIGIIICLMQITIYMKYMRKYKIIRERDLTPTIGIGNKENNNIKEEAPIKINQDEEPVKIISKTDV